ncbi:hypothetical protein BDU57DRAFT_536884 [Ampelomyces quisqualis]|uniref:Uncharacterized protein n=1 Tax=Ampelomyces quisqualis TaxID=50730 RepID=A0A6A5QVY1_AMPQU|nr:hypothetical protein BDU57DRAFT_536884 [Ampelomyces quisqualis]
MFNGVRERIDGASSVVPRALIITVLDNGVFGLAESVPGASALTCIILIMGICGTIGLLGTASRMLWAFAREDGVNLSGYVARVEAPTALPLYAIGITALIAVKA